MQGDHDALTNPISQERTAEGSDASLISVPILEVGDGKVALDDAKYTGRPKLDQLWEFTRASVLEGQGWFRLNIIAFVLICVFVLEKLFSLRFENMSRHRRALLLQCATFASGFSGPIGCFLIWLLRYRVIRCQNSVFFDAFDFPSWTGPTLVFIMSYFVFTLAIYRFLGPDIHLNVHSYMNSRARLMTSGNTLSERSAQIAQLQSKHIDYAISRFRHDSGYFKIALHALYKTYAIFVTAISASYIILFLVVFIIFVILILALIRHLFPSSRVSLFFLSVNFSAFIVTLCKLFAFFVCFSLPIFIQQGDNDSKANFDRNRGADSGCIFFYTTFYGNSSTIDMKNYNSRRTDMYCDSTFWTQHLAAYFSGMYPSVLYYCPLRMSFATLWSLPLFALLDLMSDLYSDDFALKNRRMTQYGLGIVFTRKCATLSHLFTDFSLSLPLLSPLRILPIAYSAIIVAFLLADPSTYFQKSCRDRAGSSSLNDQQQLAFGSTLAAVVMFGLVLSFFNRAITIVRLYHSHYKDGKRLLKAMFKGAGVQPQGRARSSALFTAKSYIEWEQAHSVLSYSRDGLNVICAFQTSSMSLLFLSCAIGIVVIAFTGINEYCTSFVTLTIFCLTTGSLLLPILFYAYLASKFDKLAAFGLHDLANLCKNLRDRRNCSCVRWDQSKSVALAQRLELRAREDDAQTRRRRSLISEQSADSSISGLEQSLDDLLPTYASAFDFSDVAESMTSFSTPLPLVAHFRKQLMAPSVYGKRLSVIDHIEALSPSDLIALEAVCSRLCKSFHDFPHPCRVLSLDVDRAFMAGLFTVVSSLIGSFLRVLSSQ